MPGFENTWSSVIVSLADITARKLTEQRLKESEKKFRTIFEAIPDLFFLVSEDTTILDYRGKKQQLYLAPEDFLGKKATNLMPPYIGTKIIDLVKITLETKDHQTMEYELELNDHIHYFEARFFYFSENKVSIFIRDITERKHTEKQLTDIAKFPSENPNPVLRVTQENVIYINKSGYDLLDLAENHTVPNYFRKEIISALNENL
jgi:PAS domain S-box-containing protein